MLQENKKQRLLILDFGSQYTQLIARRVRNLGVYCEIFSYTITDDVLLDYKPVAIILSGGPETVAHASSPLAPEIVFKLGVPVLGICYGMQLMAKQLGGKIVYSEKHEFGHTPIKLKKDCPLLKDIFPQEHQRSDDLNVWMSHGDHVLDVPSGFSINASSPSCPVVMMADESRQWYGLQFHPEVTHTEHGSLMLENFLYVVVKCKKQWTPQSIIEQSIQKIKDRVKDQRVLLGLSGGVDSSVMAVLLHQAIGSQLSCILVDNGLLRFNEAEQVLDLFERKMHIPVTCVRASDVFLSRLQGVTDPETKRKIIGKTFIDIFEQEARKLDGIRFLAQGTIYPDVIESASSEHQNAHVIKSHHNVGGLPENLKLDLIEPLRNLFKDEVRLLGKELGLSSEFIDRHPFPGPGLAVRIVGEVSQKAVSVLQKVDAIFLEELYAADLYLKVSQAFAVFLPIKSVGVVGDQRRYGYVVCLRAVETIDFMTAKSARLPFAFLEKVSSRIINEVSEISRVTYDISSKPPATIEWE